MWYADTDAGNDNNSCTAAGAGNACKTIGGASGKASAGGTVNIAAGTYFENVTIPKNLTLTGAGAATTAIDAEGAGTVVTVPTGVTASITGVTIQNGAAPAAALRSPRWRR
ncbi:MAG: hypothetical protein NTZ05_23520 [Chloroflexi bacterium]|nr:hypothetical protein [Chloroflexota bacterium]